MELNFLDAFIPSIAMFLGVDPATFVLLLGGFVTICNIVSRLIPDDSVGALAVIRKICKIIGLYVPNRVAPGVSTSDVASQIAHHSVHTVVDSAETRAEEVVKSVVPAFPGLEKGPGRDLSTGQFVSKILKDSDDASR